MRYACGNKKIYVYISKNYDKSSITFKMDGTLKNTVQAEAMLMEIPIYEYNDSIGNTYYQSSFEYLNTYYSFSGMLDEEDFRKILENIWIKNA